MDLYVPVSVETVCSWLSLPSELSQSYEVLGVKSLYQWQSDLLYQFRDSSSFPFKNLVYRASTSAGKSFVSDLLLFRTMLLRKHKVMIVLPYVSMVIEKQKYYKKLLRRLNRNQQKSQKINVRAVYGENGGYNIYKDHIFITTIEKANRIFNDIVTLMLSNLENGEALKFPLGSVVIDEMHVIGSNFNGYLLEILITKALMLQKSFPDLQLIAMSATVSNTEEIANWMNAVCFETDFRPVPLNEFVVSGLLIYDKSGNVVDRIQSESKQYQKGQLQDDLIAILDIVLKALRSKQQVILFSPNKDTCINMCKLIGENISVSTAFNEKVDEKISTARLQLQEKLVSLAIGKPMEVLISGVLLGAAFHTSQLRSEERTLIEKAFKDGVIDVIVATSTLAAGVNLPASVILIQSLSIGRDQLGVMQYRQMSGRAGRAGQTDRGVSYIVVKSFELSKALKLLSETFPPVQSQLIVSSDGGNALLKALIDAIGTKICHKVSDVHTCISSTLLFHQSRKHGTESNNQETLSSNCLQYLVSSRIVDISDQNIITLSKFGKAILKCNMDPDEAVVVYDALIRARDGLILDVSIHLMYLISPFELATTKFYPDFKKLLLAYDKSNKSTEKRLARVFEAIGIDYSFLAAWSVNPPLNAVIDSCFDRIKLKQMMENSNNSGEWGVGRMSDESLKVLCYCRRIWMAGIMSAVAEALQPLILIAKEYSCDIRDLESLRYSTILMAAKVKRFCNEIGWSALGRLIDNFKESTLIGNASQHLNSLLELKCLNDRVARILFDAGIVTVEELSVRSVDEIARVLLLADRFEPGMISHDRVEEQGVAATKAIFSGSESYENDFDKTSILQNERFLEWIATFIEAAKLVVKKRESESNEKAAILAEALTVADAKDFENQTINEQLFLDESSDEELDEIVDDASSVNSLDQAGEWERLDGSEQFDDELHVNENHDFEESMPSQKRSRDDSNDLLDDLPTKLFRPDASSLGNCASYSSTNNIDEVDVQHGSVDSTDLEEAFVVLESDETNNQNELIYENIPTLMTKNQLSASKLKRSLSLNESLNVHVKTIEKQSDYCSLGVPYRVSQVNSPVRYLYYPKEERDGSAQASAWISPHHDIHRDAGPKHDESNSNRHGFDRADVLSSEVDDYPSTAARVSDQLNSFCVKDLSVPDDFQLFLQKLRNCRCISFELVYRRLPRLLSGASYSSEQLNCWLPFLSWCCPNTSSESWGGVATGTRTAPLDADDRCMSGDPHILAGIAFAFGDSYGFHLSLPCPLPLNLLSVVSQSKRRSALSYQREGLLNRLLISGHQRVLVLICRFVGFQTIMRRHDHLEKLYRQSTQNVKSLIEMGTFQSEITKHVESGTRKAATNGLLLVSRDWAIVCRKAFIEEWQERVPKEWQLIDDILGNNQITKVAMHIKSKIVSLLERNITVRGFLQDPSVATVIIETFGLTLSKEEKYLNLPPSRTITPGVSTKPSLLDWRRACHRAVATIRLMGQLERHMKRAEAGAAFDLFHAVEMPLLRSVAQLEYHGMPINSTFLYNLRQDLQDRKSMIEHNLKETLWSNFSSESKADVSRVNERLVENFNREYLSIHSHQDSLHASDELLRITATLKWKRHPIHAMINEHRSVAIMAFPRVIELLQYRMRTLDAGDRVRAFFDQFGAQVFKSTAARPTGRLIAYNPALQSAPKECHYIPVKRWNLLEEMLHDKAKEKLFIRMVERGVPINIRAIHGPVCIISESNHCQDLISVFGDVDQVTKALTESYSIGQLRRLNKGAKNRHSDIAPDWWVTVQFRSRSSVVMSKTFLSRGHSSAHIVTAEGKPPITIATAGNPSVGIFPPQQIIRLEGPLAPDEEELNLLKDSLLRPMRYVTDEAVMKSVSGMRRDVRFRDVFSPPKGYLLVSADFSQFELRVLAHFSKDPNLCAAFHSNQDIFFVIASLWLKKPIRDISTSERAMVKQLCYAGIYGAGARLIAETLGVTVKEARDNIEDFLKTYSGIADFIEAVKEKCRKCGYIETLLGRRRLFPAMNSSDWKKRGSEERAAVNSMIQGSAADIIKLVMINVQHLIDTEFKEPTETKRIIGGPQKRCERVRLVHMIHDELLYEVKEADVVEMADVLRECMEHVVELRVPLKANVKIGPSWGSMIPFSDYLSRKMKHDQSVPQTPSTVHRRRFKRLSSTTLSSILGNRSNRSEELFDEWSKPLIFKPPAAPLSSSLLPLFDKAHSVAPEATTDFMTKAIIETVISSQESTQSTAHKSPGKRVQFHYSQQELF